jgi:hypothetical protein
LVTEYWRDSATAESARIDAVTNPNPIDRKRSCMV